MTKIFAKLLFWSILGHVTAASTLRPVITTTNGTLVGAWNKQYNQDIFLGIPYAQPPTGNLRYQRPKPLDQPWEQRNAVEFGPWCHSAPLALPVFTQSGFSHEESEDCLTLNIVRPATAHKGANLPVLVYVHGGGFVEGSGADQRYNMSFLVQDSVNIGAPIIGVTINYRISGFGFLPGRAVRQAGVANLGLHDQRLALSWIQDNIAAFGGDPSKVTIQGESAGAICVGHQFRAYGGRDYGLFRAGIVESGGPAAIGTHLSIEDQDLLYRNVLNQTGCTNSNDTLNCLRSAPVGTLKNAFQGVAFFPVLDEDMIEELPAVALEKGRFIQRPLLTGTNTNEGTSFAISEGFIVNSTAELRTAIARYLGHGVANTTSDAVAAEYLEKLSPKEAQTSLGSVSLTSRPEYGALYGRATLFRGDQLFIGPRRLSTKMWAKYGVPAYSYRFDTVPSGVDPATLGVTHFAEIPFVFRNFDGVGYQSNFLGSDSTEERLKYVKLSHRMSRMWLSFVNELSPNAYYALDSNVRWPVYTNRSAVNMVFKKSGIHLEQDNFRARAISLQNSASAQS
ncbi:carotenoid ester lipase-like protein precursor [Plenodomus tracheiphilus IPT5]|uniref:Carboxylic ester hydrolase n=1 Tax=Plenodomus tracheiphilus IPT5 TaxID=1408161 RepID=A0A6A7BKQ9_9PLEO|nr:carotenoid ester lipase-like protein precursor [Plenodomus tracheiphilus IPT5]